MNQQALSDWLANLKVEVDRTNPVDSRNIIPGWPIPFFGNILHARVLTVGVNPSDKEFSPGRRWNTVINHSQWQDRLMNYFHNKDVHPWIWFETWSMCLTLLDLGYAGEGAAHIDVSPRTTRPMLDQTTDKEEFRSMVVGDVKWFFELLEKLTQVQLLLIAGPIPRADGSKQQLADFIREHAKAHGAQWIDSQPLPKLVTPGHPNGIPVFICPFELGVDGLYAMVRQVHRNRELLLRLSAPQTNGVSIMPARLDWPSVIGNFITNFGMLDLLVQDFMETLFSPEEFLKMKDRPFFDRAEPVKQRLAQDDCVVTNKPEFQDFFTRLDPLRETRNHIAHGILRIRLSPDQKTFVQTLSLPKDLDGTEGRRVEFSELLAEVKTLSAFIEEFQRLAEFEGAQGHQPGKITIQPIET
jgi:hypothetical protein